MGSTFSINQLFSESEQCLKYGRQVLSFNLNFSQSTLQTVSANSVNTTRPFDGIKGMFLQGSRDAFVISGQQNFQSNTGAQQILKNPLTKKYYWFDGSTILPFGQQGQYSISNVPAGISAITNQINQTVFGTQEPGRMGPDGFIYMMGMNGAGDTYTVLKIDPDSGVVKDSLDLPTQVPESLNGFYSSFAISSTGIIAIGFYGVTNPGGVDHIHMMTVDTSTFTKIGEYEFDDVNTQGAVFSTIFDSIGNVLVFTGGQGTGTTFLNRISLGTLTAGIYSGSETDLSGSLPANLQALGVIANNSGGYVVRTPNGPNGTAYVFDAADVLLGSRTFNVNSPTFFVDEISSNMEKGFQFFYVQYMVFGPDGIIPIGMEIMAVDSFTLGNSGGVTIPFAPNGQPTFNGMTVDTDNGDMFWPNFNNSLSFSNQTASEVTVTVNGTGQSFTFEITPTFFAWIPLLCRVGDVLTFKASSGTISGFLTNFDVEPFINQ